MQTTQSNLYKEQGVLELTYLFLPQDCDPGTTPLFTLYFWGLVAKGKHTLAIQ